MQLKPKHSVGTAWQYFVERQQSLACFPILGAEKLQNCVKKKIVRIWKTFTKLIKKTSFLLTEVADLHSVISYKTGAKPWQIAFLGQKLFA